MAQDVTQSPVDCGQLIPMVDAVENNLGRKPEQASADSGYCSQANLEALESRLIDGYVATGRATDAAKDEVGLEATDACVEPAKPPTRVEAGCKQMLALEHHARTLEYVADALVGAMTPRQRAGRRVKRSRIIQPFETRRQLVGPYRPPSDVQSASFPRGDPRIFPQGR